MTAKLNSLLLPVGVLSLFLLITPASSSAASTDPAPVSSPRHSDIPANITMENQLLTAINKIRIGANLPELTVRPELSEAARLHSKTMADSNTLTHVDANGHNAGDRIRDAGYPAFTQVGENIAMNGGYSDPVDKAVTDWMASSGHRVNIMNPTFTETGVGISEKDGVYYFTEVFARPQTGTITDKARVTASTTPSDTNEVIRTRLLERINTQRKAHGLAAVKFSESLSAAAQAGSAAIVEAMKVNAKSLAPTPLNNRLQESKYVATGPIFENLTLDLDDVDRVIDLWQSNGGTVYANMMRPEIVEIGIGHTCDRSATIARSAWDILFAVTL